VPIYEAPDGNVICQECVDDREVMKWQREVYIETEPEPGEFCNICGDQF